MLALVLLTSLLTACSSQAQIDQAHANKAKLDQELTHARNDLGLPERLLTLRHLPGEESGQWRRRPDL